MHRCCLNRHFVVEVFVWVLCALRSWQSCMVYPPLSRGADVMPYTVKLFRDHIGIRVAIPLLPKNCFLGLFLTHSQSETHTHKLNYRCSFQKSFELHKNDLSHCGLWHSGADPPPLLIFTANSGEILGKLGSYHQIYILSKADWLSLQVLCSVNSPPPPSPPPKKEPGSI